jgi:hypothetical protein
MRIKDNRAHHFEISLIHADLNFFFTATSAMRLSADGAWPRKVRGCAAARAWAAAAADACVK